MNPILDSKIQFSAARYSYLRKTRRSSSSHVHFAQPLASASHPSTLPSSGPSQQPSLTSSQEVQELFDSSTPTLTPSPPNSLMAERRGRETPPHLAESEAASRAPGTSTSPPAPPAPPPALNPQLQAAMLGLMTTMTHQFRAEAQANRSPSIAARYMCSTRYPSTVAFGESEMAWYEVSMG